MKINITILSMYKKNEISIAGILPVQFLMFETNNHRDN